MPHHQRAKDHPHPPPTSTTSNSISKLQQSPTFDVIVLLLYLGLTRHSPVCSVGARRPLPAPGGIAAVICHLSHLVIILAASCPPSYIVHHDPHFYAPHICSRDSGPCDDDAGSFDKRARFPFTSILLSVGASDDSRHYSADAGWRPQRRGCTRRADVTVDGNVPPNRPTGNLVPVRRMRRDLG